MMLEASSIASIVGLITTFVSGRKSDQQAELTEFIKWLTEHRHEQVVDLLEGNQKTSISIKALLNKQSSDLKLSIDELNSSIARIAVGMPDFAELAKSINPDYTLSPQAIRVLRQISSSKAREVQEQKMQGGVIYILLPGGPIELEEQQFIEEDFENLVAVGLLRQEKTLKGTSKYKLTRDAHKYIEKLDNSSFSH